MAITLAQRSFSGGEIAPALYARTDTTKYATGARTMRNTFVKRSGGTQNRSGTYFTGQTKIMGKSVRLIPFIFNNDQTYQLEFGEEYMRVIRNGAYVIDGTQNITGITTAAQAVFTKNSHGYVTGQEVFLYGVVGMPLLNNRNYTIEEFTSNSYKLRYLDGSYVSTVGSTYISGGFTDLIYEIETPYLEAELMELKFVQSADVITIAHRLHPVMELKRSGHTSWTLTNKTFTPSIDAPINLSVSQYPVPPNTAAISFVVTSLKKDTYEESLPSGVLSMGAPPGGSPPTAIYWDLVADAVSYNVYILNENAPGVFGFLGTSNTDVFIWDYTPGDFTKSPPEPRNPFVDAGNYPSAVTIYQQRMGFAATDLNPETAYFSKSGSFNNFTTSIPIADDDAVTFTTAGRQVNKIRHMLDIGTLVLFTQSAEIASKAEIMTPFDVQLKTQTYNGSSELPPITIDGSALYVQERGSIIRDISFSFESDGYRGNDLTIFASHLVDKHVFVDWAYQKTPNSIVWAVRNDGTLLGLTYVGEQQILAWHHHDTLGGQIENVSVIPEGNEDAVYLVVRREVDGNDVRYVERMTTRQVNNIEDCIYVDSALTYDGRNADGSHTLTINSGTTWNYNELLVLNSNVSTFSTASVGRVYKLGNEDGDLVDFRITEYTSATSVKGFPDRTVPLSLRATATNVWAAGVKTLSGLWHLEGKQLSVFADGYVVANPNNPSYNLELIVTNGSVTLDRHYSVIHAGLPYVSDLETLDIDLPGTSSVVGKKKIVNKVYLQLEESRGLWVGPHEPSGGDLLENMTELKIRQFENYDDPVRLATSREEVIIQAEWSEGGRVFMRQVDPLPLSILAVFPEGTFSISGG